jgi:hypothetical protein
MKFDDILRWFGDKPWFDFEMVLLVSKEAAPCVHTELYRWRRGGKIIELRRGVFVLAEPWRHGDLEGATLAEAIYAPSYLSGRWALVRAGVFNAAAQGSTPEYTSVTARPARVFENDFGVYRYDTLPRDLLFGTHALSVGGRTLRAARLEKAVLDHCFVEGGEWDEARFEALGVNAAGCGACGVDLGRLVVLAASTGRPRLIKAAEAFSRQAAR